MLYLIAGAVAAYTVYQLFFGDNRDDRPPSPSQQPPHRSSQPPIRRRDERQFEYRQNIDSAQREDTPVEAYASLRARAKQEGDLMAQCYRQSQEAYERRDRARAKALSDKGKRHALKMERLNADACATIFKGKVTGGDVAPLLHGFQDRTACEVDLHGLYVKEAITYSKKAITDARRRGDHEIRLIVGQGNHSEGGVSRLKPAIQEDMQMRGHRVEVDPRNPGVLLVQLGGR